MSPSHGTSGQNVQKSDEEAEKVFLQENSFVCEEPAEEPDQSRKRRIFRKVTARKRRAVKEPFSADDSDFQTTSDTFTEKQEEEFADKKVRKAAERAEQAGRNLKKAKAEIPVQKNYTMKRVFDEKTGKAKYLLVPVEEEKPFQPESLKKRAVHRLELEGVQVVHGKIAEAEKENAAVEGAHKSEQALESAYHYAKAHGKEKEQRKREQISRLEKKKMHADVELAYQEFLRDNPQLNEEGIHKQLQKQLQKKRIQREYVKARRAGAEAGAARDTFRKSTNAVTGIAKKLQEIAAKNQSLLLGAGIFGLLVLMIMAGFSSCGSMFLGTITTTLATTYLSLPAEIDAADLSFSKKEMELQNTIDATETDHPGYDEYDYNLGEIGHDPYTLISYLSAVYTEFTAEEVEGNIQELFDSMYSLTTEEIEETRTRTVTKTGTRTVTGADGEPVLGADGKEQSERYEYEEEEEYTVLIFRTTLTVTPLESIVDGRMDTEQAEIFAAYAETKGGLQVFGTPVDYYWYSYISSYYGYRKNPNTEAEELHRGMDIAVPTGTDVYAVHDGTVTEAAFDAYYGNYVVITDQQGYTTKYAHMDSVTVSAGQSVTKGDPIGKSGNTGSSTGSHLHIECLYNGEYYNPLFYFEAGTQTLYGEIPGGNGGNVIPPESYDDAAVAALMREANKYLGMPYTFGGTPPSSFDCSAFVCWVFSNSGVHDLPRTTAQGIYDQCAPVSAADAKAGDIIFFTGTYNAGRPVTHVGIYCGNGIMVHCGDPIQYTSIHSAYWQSHFYGFGRLN